MNAIELKSALRQFTGTEEWYFHPLFRKYRYTEGVKFLATEAGAYWLLEKILSLQLLDVIKGEGFQLWRLSVQSDKSAILSCEDGNSEVIYQEVIDYTDFPLEETCFYFTDSVLLLPSEY